MRRDNASRAIRRRAAFSRSRDDTIPSRLSISEQSRDKRYRDDRVRRKALSSFIRETPIIVYARVYVGAPPATLVIARRVIFNIERRIIVYARADVDFPAGGGEKSSEVQIRSTSI